LKIESLKLRDRGTANKKRQIEYTVVEGDARLYRAKRKQKDENKWKEM